MDFTIPTQTSEGVSDAKTFALLRTRIAVDSLDLFRLLCVGWEPGSRPCGINCHVLSRVYEHHLNDFSVSRKSGYFGMPDFSRAEEGKVKMFEHSWLVPECAPGWVLDVAPFNGFLSPLIVCASALPWQGLYREEPIKAAVLTEAQEELAGEIAKKLAQCIYAQCA